MNVFTFCRALPLVRRSPRCKACPTSLYRCDTDGEPVFVEVPAPTDEALETVLHKVITRLMKLLTRRGVLVEEEDSTYMADSDSDSDEARTLRPLQAAACTYRIAFGPRAGQKVLTLQGAMPRDADFKQTLCSDIQGFSAARRRALRRRRPPGAGAGRTAGRVRGDLCAPPSGSAELGQATEAGFEIDMAQCLNCGGELKIIAAIMGQPVIEKILTHLGLQARAPPRTPARRSQLQAA